MATQRDVSPRQLVKLREFSTQLAQRLKEAPHQPLEPTRLAVRIGAFNYLVEMGSASEIVALPELARVPWTKPWYRGLANVRGRLVGVVDLLHLMGRDPLSAEQGQQLLVLGESLGVAAGVLVTRAFGIRNLKDLDPLDATAGGGASGSDWERNRWRDRDGMLMTELDLRELAHAPVFTAISA